MSKMTVDPQWSPESVRFNVKDMRAAFVAGAAFERGHQFMPPEIRPVKAAEEAAARWPD